MPIGKEKNHKEMIFFWKEKIEDNVFLSLFAFTSLFLCCDFIMLYTLYVFTLDHFQPVQCAAAGGDRGGGRDNDRVCSFVGIFPFFG